MAGECWRSCASNPRARRYHNYERSISFSAGDCSGAARLPHHKCAPVSLSVQFEVAHTFKMNLPTEFEQDIAFGIFSFLQFRGT